MYIRIYCLIIAILFANILKLSAYEPLSDAQLDRLVPSDTRVVTSLAGNWQKSYDEINWENCELPYSELSEKTVIYKRTIRIDRNLIEANAWHLHFLGIDHQVEVFINEQFVGKYFGGMAPFKVRIPDRMMSSENNTIKLIISPARNYASQSRSQFLYAKKIYTGIIREMLLIGTPPVWINEINYKTDFNENLSRCDLTASIKISSAQIEKIRGNTTFRDTTGRYIPEAKLFADIIFVDATSGDSIAKSNKLDFDIESERTIEKVFKLSLNNYNLWSPENPNLYLLKVRIWKENQIIDNYMQPVGLRDIKIIKKDGDSRIYLNNRHIELKGVTYVEDYIDGNMTLDAKRMEQDIELMKTLGNNLLRIKFLAPHPYLVDLCDRNGIMMFVELPIYDVPSAIISLNEIQVHIENIGIQMIDSYDNHTSVIGWGISDGLMEESDAVKSFSNKMINLFKRKSDKLIYKIIPFGSDIINTEGFDLIGIRNNRTNLSFSEISNEVKRIKELTDNAPIFSSYGVPIQIDNRNGYSDKLSLEYQAYNILNSYRIITENQLLGGIYTTFNDYLLEAPLLVTNNTNQYLSTQGLFDRNRQQRISLATLQSLFNKEKEPLLNVGSFTLKTPVSFIVFGLILAIILVLMINRFKRFREYLFRSFLRPYNFYADIRDQRIMSIAQTFIIGVIMALILGMYITSILNYYRTSELAQFVLMLLIPSNAVMEVLFKIIWMPELSMLIISLLFFLFTILLALIIRVFAIFTRARIYLRDTLTISIWSGVPIFFILPVAIILTRILVLSPSTIFLFLILFFVIIIWSIARMLRCTSVVFDIRSFKVYFIGIFILLLLFGIPLFIYHLKYSIIAYAQYFVEVLMRI